MVGGDFTIREATGADMPGIARVRSSVRENLLTNEQLAERGITNASVAASLLANRKGWLAEGGGEIVAFSMADRENGSLFALFVVPEYGGRGLGSRLLDLALQWLWDNGTELA
jgi:GNAT superfamily N-acetyltransferase